MLGGGWRDRLAGGSVLRHRASRAQGLGRSETGKGPRWLRRARRLRPVLTWRLDRFGSGPVIGLRVESLAEQGIEGAEIAVLEHGIEGTATGKRPGFQAGAAEIRLGEAEALRLETGPPEIRIGETETGALRHQPRSPEIRVGEAVVIHTVHAEIEVGIGLAQPAFQEEFPRAGLGIDRIIGPADRVAPRFQTGGAVGGIQFCLEPGRENTERDNPFAFLFLPGLPHRVRIDYRDFRDDSAGRRWLEAVWL